MNACFVAEMICNMYFSLLTPSGQKITLCGSFWTICLDKPVNSKSSSAKNGYGMSSVCCASRADSSRIPGHVQTRRSFRSFRSLWKNKQSILRPSGKRLPSSPVKTALSCSPTPPCPHSPLRLHTTSHTEKRGAGHPLKRLRAPKKKQQKKLKLLSHVFAAAEQRFINPHTLCTLICKPGA